MTLSGVVPGDGTSVILSHGSDEAIDIDMHLLEGIKVVAQDIGPDSSPQITDNFIEGLAYRVKLSNVDGEEALSFVVGGVLRVR